MQSCMPSLTLHSLNASCLKSCDFPPKYSTFIDL